VAGAQDVARVAGQVAVVQGRERPAGVRAAVDVAARAVALAHHEAGEQPVALAEAEALAAGIGDLGERAEARPRGGRPGCRAQSWPSVTRNGVISTRSQRPALV
jgi:hypothetical protein